METPSINDKIAREAAGELLLRLEETGYLDFDGGEQQERAEWLDRFTKSYLSAIERATEPAHQVLDKLGAPRTNDDETYTVAQRILFSRQPQKEGEMSVRIPQHSEQQEWTADKVEMEFRYRSQRDFFEHVASAHTAALAAERQHDMCDACAGTGKPTSGKPCMCNGTGRMSVAALTLRKELYDERQRCEQAGLCQSHIAACELSPRKTCPICADINSQAAIEKIKTVVRSEKALLNGILDSNDTARVRLAVKSVDLSLLHEALRTQWEKEQSDMWQEPARNSP